MLKPIEHNREEHNFKMRLDDSFAILEYKVKEPGVLEYYSTYVPKKHRGKNVATNLAEKALRYAKINDFTVQPTCPFVKKVIKENPEFESIES